MNQKPQRPRVKWLIAGLASLILAGLPSFGLGAQVPGFHGTILDPHLVFSPVAPVEIAMTLVLEGRRYTGPLQVSFTELRRVPEMAIPQKRLDYGCFPLDGTARLSLNGHPLTKGDVLSANIAAESGMDSQLAVAFTIRLFPTSVPPPGSYRILLQADLIAGGFGGDGAIVDTLRFWLTIEVGEFNKLALGL